MKMPRTQRNNGKPDSVYGNSSLRQKVYTRTQKTTEKNRDKVSGTPREFAFPDWKANDEEILEAIENLFKRIMINTNKSYDNLLEKVKARKAELKYKPLILFVIKRTASGTTRSNTETRNINPFCLPVTDTSDWDLPNQIQLPQNILIFSSSLRT